MRSFIGLALILTNACGGEPDAFDHCPELHGSGPIEADGTFQVDLAYSSARSPETNFRAFVNRVSETSVELSACQLDHDQRLWRFTSIWTHIPPREQLPAPASFPIGSAPTIVYGEMIRCRDDACEDVQVVLNDIVPLYRNAISVEDYSAADGVFRGYLLQTVGRWADGSALLQIHFDLDWDAARGG